MTAPLDPWDRALLAALDSNPGPDLLDLEQLADAAGVSPALVEVVMREGFLKPHRTEPVALFDPNDVLALRAGFALVDAGLPLGELLDLARRADQALRPIAEQAVEVFARFIRDAVEASSATDEEASRRLVEAVQSMLPATGRLVEHHFRQLLAEGARRKLDR